MSLQISVNKSIEITTALMQKYPAIFLELAGVTVEQEYVDQENPLTVSVRNMLGCIKSEYDKTLIIRKMRAEFGTGLKETVDLLYYVGIHLKHYPKFCISNTLTKEELTPAAMDIAKRLLELEYK